MSTILSEQVPKPLKSWPGLFELHQNPDGSFRVELGVELIRRELRLRWKLSANEGELALALMMLAHLSADMPEKFLALMASKIRDSFGDDLKTLSTTGESMPAKSRARKNIEKVIRHALDAVENKGTRRSHGSAIAFEFYGDERPLAWFVIEHARKLVETNQRLPSKGEVRESIKGAQAASGRVSSAQWAAAFKEAGLASLERAGTW